MPKTACLGLALPLLVSLGIGAGAARADSGPYALRTGNAPQGMVGAVHADNPTNGLSAWIGAEQVRVTARAATAGAPGKDRPPADAWSVSFSLQRIGRGARLRAVDAAGVEADGHRAELHRGSLVEWYDNGPAGLEQGFDLAVRPAGGSGSVVLELEVAAGDLVALLDGDGQAVSFLRPGSPLSALVYRGLVVTDADGRRLAAAMELDTADGSNVVRLVFDDRGARYPVRVDPLLNGAAWSSAESESIRSVAWGDWDGDGDLDLATGNYAQPNRVYENTGGVLTSAWISDESDPTTSVAWGDWDGDGNLDLAAGNELQPNRVYENTGGTLAPTAAWSSDELDDSTQSVAWGDWDGDGDLDLAVGNLGPNRIYENTGGTLASAWTSAESDQTVDVAWGDWNGDGDLDLAAGNYAQPSRVYENNGGTLTSVWTSAESDQTGDVAWGDWDGDGDLDLATGNYQQSNRVYENEGVTLTSAWTSVDTDKTRSVAWGDWDGDGDLDLAAGNDDQQLNRVYENQGGTLASAWTSTDEDNTLSVAWGDWDGDGDLDLTAGNIGQPIRIYESTGGTLATTGEWSSDESHFTWSVAWGDWDGDGDLDLAVGNSGQPNRVYENTGGTLATTAAWGSAESDNTRSVAWGDWDGDGDLDLAAGNDGQPSRVYENTGGTLATTAAWSSTESDDTQDLAWGDWDGDGDLDLAVGNTDSVGAPNRVYENTGGTLATTASWSSSEEDSTSSLAWGDWDGDGDLDLAVGNTDSVGAPNRVYENTGGTLATTAAWSSSEEDSTGSVAWGDWDGDGDLDLAVGNVGDPNRVYENTDGALATAAAWSSTEEDDHTQDLAWGDWDGDGDLDLAAGNSGQPNRVYENTGGTLATTAAWSSTESDETLSVAWGDWDGDGDLDLAAGSTSFAGAPNRVYRNGTLARPIGLPETPVSPVIARRPHGGSITATAAAYSSECLTGSLASLDYSLVDEESDPARRVVMEHSRDGAHWLPASLAGGDGTENVSASTSGASHQLVWDPLADGVAYAPLVHLRVTVPSQASTRLSGPIQRAAMRAVSPPFSLCVPTADLTVTIDDGAGSATPGNPITYLLTVANAGPDDAIGVSVTDTFPAALTGVTWSCATGGGGGACGSPNGSGDVAASVDLPAGGSVAFTIDATVDPGATGTLAYTATAALAASPHEMNPADNSATDLDVLVPSSDLSVSNDDGQSDAVPGWTVTYTVTVTNGGPSDAYAAQVVDLFPAALTGVTWSCVASGGGSCTTSGSGDIEESVDLPVGATVTFTAGGTIDPAATGHLVTSASALTTIPQALRHLDRVQKGVSTSGGDPDPSNNNAVDVDTLVPFADLAIVKDNGRNETVLGGQVTYTIVVTNLGPSSAPALVTDAFPADLLNVTWTCATGGGGGTCAAGGSGSIVDLAHLPAGGSLTYTATATVDESSTATSLSNSASVTPLGGVTEVGPADNASTDLDMLVEGLFGDGFETGDTSGWSAATP